MECKHEDSPEEFEEFQEEYVTYDPAALASRSVNAKKKSHIVVKTEKPKLILCKDSSTKVRHQRIQSLGENICKSSPNNPKIISIGETIFRSNYESANLQSVKKIGPKTFEIRLGKEQNSERVSAWFFFTVEGIKGEAEFILKGFTKTNSLYNNGMKICYRVSNQSVWRRGGTKIFYMESCDEDEEVPTFELHFTFFFKSDFPNSTEFAYCFPYTYSRLLDFIVEEEKKMCHRENCLEISTLGKTYQNRDIPLLIIGNKNNKNAIFLTARTHPGETVGSFVMEGFVKTLLYDCEFGAFLRENFCFYVVPMINPDGVVNGNYRFSAAGFDLNRKWRNCTLKMQPEVYHLKEKIKEIKERKDIVLYIDFHGHSRQKNTFFYGCASHNKNDNKNKEFPYLLSKVIPAFRYDYCSYSMSKDKEGTARITLWNQLGINYIYTLETSLCGPEGQTNFLISDYEKIGAKLCEGICIYFGAEMNNDASNSFLQKLQDIKSKTLKEFYNDPNLLCLDYEGNSSDSDPEAGEIPEGERNNKNILRSFKKASRSSKKNNFSFSFNNDLESEHLKSKTSFTHQNSRKKTIVTLNGESSHIERTHQSLSVEVTPKSKMVLTKNRTELCKKTPKNVKMEESLASSSAMNKDLGDHFQNHLLLFRKLEEEKSKRKSVRFEGAQFRRIRKMAEEHNKRQIVEKMWNEENHMEDETLIKGLLGMNNLAKIDNNQFLHRPPSFFPNNSSGCKNKKDNLEKAFQKPLRKTDFTPVKYMGRDVQCRGRQIL